MPTEKPQVHAVILAGGRGTRVWPLNRTKTPKQLLDIGGPGTMLRQTVGRLRPLVTETGFGYIERMEATISADGVPVYPVRRFAEKPVLKIAKEYLDSGNYQWNAGMFFWRVSTILDELKKHLPQTFDVLQKLAAHIGT